MRSNSETKFDEATLAKARNQVQNLPYMVSCAPVTLMTGQRNASRLCPDVSVLWAGVLQLCSGVKLRSSSAEARTRT